LAPASGVEVAMQLGQDQEQEQKQEQEMEAKLERSWSFECVSKERQASLVVRR